MIEKHIRAATEAFKEFSRKPNYAPLTKFIKERKIYNYATVPLALSQMGLVDTRSRRGSKWIGTQHITPILTRRVLEKSIDIQRERDAQKAAKAVGAVYIPKQATPKVVITEQSAIKKLKELGYTIKKPVSEKRVVRVGSFEFAFTKRSVETL